MNKLSNFNYKLYADGRLIAILPKQFEKLYWSNGQLKIGLTKNTFFINGHKYTEYTLPKWKPFQNKMMRYYLGEKTPYLYSYNIGVKQNGDYHQLVITKEHVYYETYIDNEYNQVVLL